MAIIGFTTVLTAIALRLASLDHYAKTIKKTRLTTKNKQL